jgi:hypothetical protein
MEKISLFGMTLFGLKKSEEFSSINSESRSSIMSPASFSPLNNLTIGICLELLSPLRCFVTIFCLKTYPFKLLWYQYMRSGKKIYYPLLIIDKKEKRGGSLSYISGRMLC